MATATSAAYRGAPVIGGGRAGGEHDLFHAIQAHGSLGHFGELVGGFTAMVRPPFKDSPMAQNWHLVLVLPPADAGLLGGGQHVVRVELGDLPVGGCLRRC